MKARHIIGIIFLVITLLFLGPMVLLPGLSINGKETPAWIGGIYAAPALILLLIGALTVGGPYRVMAAGWTLFAGALYGAFLLLTVGPMFASPDFNEVMQATQAQQGIRSDITLTFSRQVPVFVALGLLVTGLGGLAHYYRGRGAVVLSSLTIDSLRGTDPAATAPDSSGVARPVSITVLAWLLIITSVLAFMTQIYPGLANQDVVMQIMADTYEISPDQWRLATGCAYVSTLVCAIFMLQGANWARWLYIVTTLANLLLAWSWFGMVSWALGGLPWIALVVFLLFLRRPADRFFRGGSGAVVA